MKKRILSMLMACMMVVSTFIISRPLVSVSAVESNGSVSFTAKEFYTVKNEISKTVETVEAYVYLPANYSSRAGVILGNYAGAEIGGFAFEIHNNGVPRLFWQQSSWSYAVDIKFDSVNVAKGEWLHIAVTRDMETKTAKCYINGELKQTVTWTSNYVDNSSKNFCIGGDYRSENGQYFKGQIRNVAAYSDVRSATEIASDASGISYTGDNLLLAYDLSKNGSDRYKDLSGNRNHIIYTNTSTGVTETYNEAGIVSAQTAYYDSTADVGTPRTIEATIALDYDAGTGRLGAIVGNYNGSKKPSFGLEIRENYVLSLWWEPKVGTSHRIDFANFAETFKNSRGKSIHLAVTIVGNTATLYVNGELFETVTKDKSGNTINAIDLQNSYETVRIGGDYRTNNTCYLKQATIYGVALYSDVRTADEIKADMTAFDTSDSALIFGYDFTKEGNVRLRDYSKNENHLSYRNGTVEEEYAGNTGVSFEKNNLLQTDAPLTAVPQTIEALVYVPSSVGSSRIGVIYGNYKTSGVDCVSMEVLAGGKPRFYWQIGSKAYDCQFSNVNIINNCWTHVTLVRDIANGKAHCYINGELVQSVNISNAAIESGYTTPICIGGDLRSGNSCSFLGKIRSIIAYSDVRSADEIKADYTAVAPDYNDTALIAHYDLSELINVNGREGIEDLTENGNDVYTPWIVDNDVNDYSYTFAVVGDTQKVSDYDLDNGTQLFAKIYDYILNNIDKQNVKLVIGLGDITENWGSYDSEWELAQENIFKLNGKVPYILNRGNHDPSNKFNAYFNNTAYSEQLEGTYNGNIDNSYFTLEVNGIKYLVMALDFGPSDAVLSWAANVVDSHPEHNVIITTHAYMYRDGTTLDQGDVCPPATNGGSNNGDDVWEKFVKNHENIVLVLSGHDPWDKIVMREDDGVNGNKVVQMLIDPQGMDANAPVGMVAMFHFSEDGKTVQVEYYSTVEEKWYHPDNQFTFTLDVVMPCEHENAPEATCKEASVCPDCGETLAPINPENHVNDGYAPNGDGTHNYVCDCGVIEENANCEYGNDNICDKCGYDCTADIAEDNFSELFDKVFNDGESDYVAPEIAEGAFDNFGAVKGEDVEDFKYMGFNLEFTAEKKIFLRHHILLDGNLYIQVGADEAVLTQVADNYYYFEVEVEIGKLAEAHEIIVDGTTVVTASVYSYMKTAFESGTLDAEQTNLLNALYAWNNAVANAN